MSRMQTMDGHASHRPDTAPVDQKLEVVIIPVSDVDRAKKFYEGLGWRADRPRSTTGPSGTRPTSLRASAGELLTIGSGCRRQHRTPPDRPPGVVRHQRDARISTFWRRRISSDQELGDAESCPCKVS